MSDLFVDNIKHQSSQGSGTITLGASGETVALASGASQTMAVNTPAFMVGLSGNQGSITAASFAKVTFDSEDVDTDNAFASNKFTVPSGKAGKYFIGLEVQMNAESGAGTAQVGSARIYKNGSAAINGGVVDFRNTNGQKFSANVSAIMDLSVGDYLEGYAELHTSSGDVTFVASSRSTKFFGYKLIGA
tara:strand:- start:47 stop:613 length:567 start_codon:yes stop_codon:yes gene_type:complete